MKLRNVSLTVITAVMASAGIVSCSPVSSPTGPEVESVVIRAYLYAGEPVTDIHISGTVPLGTDSVVVPPINDAEVWLIRNDVQYDLVPSSGDSGYYHYDGTDLTVMEGDQFEIGVVHSGRTATGSTVVPIAPANLAGSTGTIVVPESFFSGDDTLVTSLELTWGEVESALWYVTVENIESDPIEIERGGGDFGGLRSPQRLISPPRPMNSFVVRSQQLTHYGQHLVRVYRINQEYADLYGSRQQDTRDLNEPLTNIRNGLGVFSAFSSVTIIFTAIPEVPGG
ncbi:DUF4249 family protein [Gemmatimonadota bacterium]